MLSAFHSHKSPHSHKFPSIFYASQTDFFLKSLLVIRWLLLNLRDPYCKQTLSLFISCFGNLLSDKAVLGVLSLHAVSILFSYNELLFKTGPSEGFVTLKLNWYKITIITFYGFDR